MDDNDPKYQRLAEALRAREESRQPFVPKFIDDAVLERAHAHFGAKQKAPRPNRLWWAWSIAGATAALACALLLFPAKKENWVREDVNHDGRVDILDALALARDIQNGRGADQNNDGQINEADINALALAAVRLDTKPGI
jgi:hypothetical protein